MTSVRLRIEAWFEGLGRAIYDHRWATLILVALVSLPILAQLPGLTVDTRTESYFLEGDTALLDYNSFRDQFGMDEFVVVAANPPQVFNLDFLHRLRALHLDLEQKVPHVAEVTSLINARCTRGEGDVLIVEGLMESWPEDEIQLAALRERVLSHPLYVKSIISEDGTFTTLVIRPNTRAEGDEDDVLAGFDDEEPEAETSADAGSRYLSSAQTSEMVRAIEAVIAAHRTAEMPLFVAGGPVVTDALNRAVPADMMRLMPLCAGVVGLFLFLLFRRLSGVIYPLMIVFLSLFCTLGMMVVLHMPMTNVTTMLTSFLLVVGVADAVHILSVFYQRHRRNGDKREAIAHALGHSGLAVAMTSVTTAVGLLSFTTADVGPIVDLGVAAPIGIAFALLFTITLLPALIAVFPVAGGRERHQQSALMDRLLASVADFACGHVRSILVVALLVTLVSVAGITRLRFSQNGLKWFKPDAPVRRATELVDAKLRGTLTLEVLIDTGRINGLHEPDFLHRLEQAVAWAEKIHDGKVYVGKATSLDLVIKEINRALNENQEAAYRIPDDRSLVAQELLLFEGTGSDDLEDLVDRKFSVVRCTLKVPFEDAFHYVDLISVVEEYFEEAFPHSEIKITGSNALYVKMFHNIITTMVKSYAISLSVITVLMMLLIGRVRIGMLSMVPNLLPLVVILGVMGWLRIPLDMSTVLIGSVAIGLVVDDTIHFMHNFRRYFEADRNVPSAVAQTLNTAGRAILVTSIVLAGGFYTTMASELHSSVIYGGLMGSTVILALVADFLVTPVLMMVANKQLAGRGAGGTRKTEGHP